MIWLRQYRRWFNWWWTTRWLMVDVLLSVVVNSFKLVISFFTSINNRDILSIYLQKATWYFWCCSLLINPITLMCNFIFILWAFTHDLACATIINVIIIITAIHHTILIYISFYTILIIYNIILSIWLIR